MRSSGMLYAGAVYTAASSRLTSGELEYILNDSGAKVFVTSKYKADQAAEVQHSTPGVQLRLMLDGTIDGYESYEALVDGQDATPLPEPRISGMDMLYSSGTTGRPKGVLRPNLREPLAEAARACRLLTVANEVLQLAEVEAQPADDCFGRFGRRTVGTGLNAGRFVTG